MQSNVVASPNGTYLHKQGCVSQVWVIPEVTQGKMYWKADSDAQLTKGLAALLVQGLSGCSPQEVCGIEPNFIEMLGLKQSLTPSRNNGFLNMFRLMQVRSLHREGASWPMPALSTLVIHSLLHWLLLLAMQQLTMLMPQLFAAASSSSHAR